MSALACCPPPLFNGQHGDWPFAATVGQSLCDGHGPRRNKPVAYSSYAETSSPPGRSQMSQSGRAAVVAFQLPLRGTRSCRRGAEGRRRVAFVGIPLRAPSLVRVGLINAGYVSSLMLGTVYWLSCRTQLGYGKPLDGVACVARWRPSHQSLVATCRPGLLVCPSSLAVRLVPSQRRLETYSLSGSRGIALHLPPSCLEVLRDPGTLLSSWDWRAAEPLLKPQMLPRTLTQSSAGYCRSD